MRVAPFEDEARTQAQYRKQAIAACQAPDPQTFTRLLWTFDPAFPISRINSGLHSKAEIQQWLNTENACRADDEPDQFYDGFIGWWDSSPAKAGTKVPVVVAQDSHYCLWDGCHRYAVAALHDQTTMPVLLGLPAPRGLTTIPDDLIAGPHVTTVAQRKARYGRRNWVIWRGVSEQWMAAPLSKECIKAAMLAHGTQDRFSMASRHDGTLQIVSWHFAAQLLRNVHHLLAY